MKMSRREFGLAALSTVVIAACGSKTPSGASSTTSAGDQQTRPVKVTGTALAALPDSGNDPGVGATPPKLEGANFAGSPVTIAPGTGGPMLVLFVAHWCPHCQAEVPRVVKWIADGGPPKDLQIFAVSTAVVKARGNYPPSQWLAKESWPKPVLADDDQGSAANAWGLQAFPYFVIVDAQGKVKKRATGEVSMDELGTMLSQAIGG